MLVPLMSEQNAFAGGCPFVQTPPQPGDIIVADDDAGAFGDGAILGVNPDTGEITVISDFCISDSSPGENFFNGDNEGLAFDPTDGSIVVANSENVFRVDPNTGGTELVSEGQFFSVECPGDFSDSGDVEQVAVMDNGDIIAASDDYFCDQRFSRVIKINPDTGVQTVIAEKGPLLDVEDVAIDANGDFVVVNGDGPDASIPGVYRVTPGGLVTSISTSGLFNNPEGVDIGDDGTIYVADEDNGIDSGGQILSVDPDTGFTKVIAGVVEFEQIRGVLTGSLYAVDEDAGCDGDGAIFEINPDTGEVELLAENDCIVVDDCDVINDCDAVTKIFNNPQGLDLFGEAVPEPEPPICEEPKQIHRFFNFDDGAPEEFSGVTTTQSVEDYDEEGFFGDLLRIPNGQSQFGKATLTLTDLPVHNLVDIKFLLAIIDSWDGQPPGGCCNPDVFNVFVDGCLFVFVGDQFYSHKHSLMTDIAN